MIVKFKKDLLSVRVYENRTAMGFDAAHLTAKRIRHMLEIKDFISIIFAGTPSQSEFLEALSVQPNIDWQRITAFHTGEYIGLSADAHQGFGSFLKRTLFSKVPFKMVYCLDGNASDLEQECERYAGFLSDYKPDIVCMDIGENADIAFNDSNISNLNDPKMVKVVEPDQQYHQQQINKGNFGTIAEVLARALTLTIPALFQAEFIFGMVPGIEKSQAVFHTLMEPVTAHYPSTILRIHPNAVLFLDKDSASELEDVTSKKVVDIG